MSNCKFPAAVVHEQHLYIVSVHAAHGMAFASRIFFWRNFCTKFEPQILSKNVATLSEEMPGWPGWELRRHNGGASCPHSQDVHTAHIQSAIRSAAVFPSVECHAFMFWRALQGLAIAHSCCGAVLWHSIKYVSTSIVIDILLLVIRTTCLRRFSGEFLQSVYAGKPYSSYT